MNGDSRGPERLEATFLTRDVRAAFEEAARDPDVWEHAKLDGREFLRGRGVAVPADIQVAFLDVQRQGDRIRYLGARGTPLLEMYCPPTKVWWQECRKIIRVCETTTVTIQDEDNPGQVKVLNDVPTNCYFVCESFIWEQALTLPTRPPFPPLPLP